MVVNQEVRGNQTILISKTDQSEFFTERFQSGPGRRKLLFFLFLFLPTVLWEISSCSNKKNRPPQKRLPVVAANKPRTLEAESSAFASCLPYLLFLFSFFPPIMQGLMGNTGEMEINSDLISRLSFRMHPLISIWASVPVVNVLSFYRHCKFPCICLVCVCVQRVCASVCVHVTYQGSLARVPTDKTAGRRPAGSLSE